MYLLDENVHKRAGNKLSLSLSLRKNKKKIIILVFLCLNHFTSSFNLSFTFHWSDTNSKRFYGKVKKKLCFIWPDGNFYNSQKFCVHFLLFLCSYFSQKKMWCPESLSKFKILRNVIYI